MESDVYAFLSQLADYCCTVWKEPDSGIWELTGKKLHYVHSKVMLWAALDRAVQLAYHYNLKGNVDKWILNRNQIHTEVLNYGFDSELGSFVQAYDSKYLDAANLRIPILGFLPASDDRVQGTINQVMKTLLVNGVLYRNNSPTEKPTPHETGNLPRQEGAFCLCTFWLVDALALSNRVEEAKKIFDHILGYTNHVGLLSEEINSLDGSMLGNFPQGFSHIGIITSALYIANAEGKEIPDAAILGTEQHKAEIEGRRPPPFRKNS